MVRRLAHRAEILRRAAIDYHVGRITLRQYLAVIVTIRGHR